MYGIMVVSRKLGILFRKNHWIPIAYHLGGSSSVPFNTRMDYSECSNDK